MPQPLTALARYADMFPYTLRAFNGTSDFDSKAIDLSAESRITVSMILNWTTFANNDALALEFTTDGTGAGGFQINPNSNAFGDFAFLMGSPTGFYAYDFPRPNAGVPHHYWFNYKRVDPTVSSAVDGVPRSGTPTDTGFDTATNFGNSTLYVMSRAGTSLFGAGGIGNIGIWGTNVTLTAAEIIKLRNGAAPHVARSAGLLAEIVY